MKLLECVKILTDHGDVKAGTVGTIVEIYKGDDHQAYEVEFPIGSQEYVLLVLTENEIESTEC